MRLLRSALLFQLALALTMLVGRSPQPSAAADRAAPIAPAASPAALSYTAYLPYSLRQYDPSYINPFGVVMYNGVDQYNGLQQLRDAGARRVVTTLDWNTIESTPGVRDWSSFDTKLRNARDAGMDVFVLFTGDPAWAWVGPDNDRSTDPLKRRDFVRAMVQRYDCDGFDDAGPGMCVRDWSFYPEPDYSRADLLNLPGAKGYWGSRPAAYAAMISDVAVTVHIEDPGARVLIGGVAYDYFKSTTCPTCPFIRSFLPDVLSALNTQHGGARQYLNAVAVHYYPLSFPTLRDKLREIRSIMQAGGVGSLPLLVPETGYWSQDDSSESQQALMVPQLFVEGLADGVEYLAWFTVFDQGAGRETWGLFRGQNLASPKPSYSAYQTVTRELAGARYLRSLGQSGIEGHVFTMPSGPDKTVVWRRGSGAAPATFAGSCLRVINAVGVSYGPAIDGGSGDQDRVVNGQIVLSVAPTELLYVQRCQ